MPKKARYEVRIRKGVVDGAKPQERGDVFIRDSDLKGFGLRVTPSGAKSYFFEYRMGGRGAPKGRIVIGKHGSPWTPDTAREKARELATKVQQGINPSVEKRQRTVIAVDLAFQIVADMFIKQYAKLNQKRSWPKAKALLDNEIVPTLKDRPLPDITTREIAGIINRIAETRPPTARYAFAILRKLFRWAKNDGLIPASPMADMECPVKVVKRDRTLSYDELIACWKVGEDTPYPFGAFLHLLIATAQRRSEVVGMDYSEIDLKRRIWTIPGRRTKNGKEHAVPLNDLAVMILEALGAGKRRRGLVFTTTGKTPASGFSKFKADLDASMLAVLCDRAEEAGLDVEEVHLAPWRFHDIRRTVATKLGDDLNVPTDVVEMILNHLSGTQAGIVSVYQTGEKLRQKRVALNLWSTKLEALLWGEEGEADMVAQFPPQLMAVA